MSGRRAALALLVGLSAPSLAAQTGPILTETALTAPSGSLVLETGGDYIHSEPNFLTGHPSDRWQAPLLRLVYSPSGNVEMDLEWVARVGALDDPDFGSVSDFGDVTLRAKLRFLDAGAGKPALAARFGVTLPQTSFGNGLGPNTLRATAQMLLSQPIGGVLLHANAGLGLDDEILRPHEQRDFFVYGVAITGSGRRFQPCVEVAGRAGDGSPGAEERSEARLGFRYHAERVSWNAALRRGLTDADGTWGFTAGVAWLARAGR